MRILVLLRSPRQSADRPERFEELGPRDHSAMQLARGLAAEAGTGSAIVAMTAGPAEDEVALRQALRRGAQRAVRVWRRDLQRSTNYTEVSALIARGAAAVGFDLILTGDRSTDWGSGMLGPAVAHRLGLPHLGGVVDATRHGPGELVVSSIYGPHRLRVSLELPAMLGIAGNSAVPPPVAPDAVQDLEVMVFDPPGSPSDPHAATLQTLGEIDMPLITRGDARRRTSLDEPPTRAPLLEDAEALLALVRRGSGP